MRNVIIILTVFGFSKTAFSQNTILTGNVGIGTSSPAVKLDVQVDAPDILRLYRATNTHAVLGVSNTSSYLSLSNDGFGNGATVNLYSAGTRYWDFGMTDNLAPYSQWQLRENVSGTMVPRITVPLGGNVGIGTATPTAKLEVRNSAHSNIWAVSGSGVNDYSQLLVTEYPIAEGSYAEMVRFSNASSYGGQCILSNFDKSILLSTSYNSGYRSDFLLTADGNVGIGKSNPLYRLDVVNSTAGASTMRLDNTATGGFLTAVQGSTNIAGFGSTGTWLGNSSTDVAVTAYAGKKLKFFTNGNTQEAMAIDLSGNVGIGTSPPVGYKLAVNGDAIFVKVKVKQHSTWPDYVFQSNYKLLPLSELEKFIKHNQHLPEIPSAAEVEKNGLDVGDNQATLLKKIEELTLYVIDLNNKVEQQSRRLRDQDKKIIRQEKEITNLSRKGK